MKNLLFLFVLSYLVLSSCMTTKTSQTLVGDYPSAPFSIETDKSFDEVWDKAIDYFAMNGISISTLEKESGLIVSNKVSLKNSITMEKDGKPLDKNAFVVIPYAKNVVYVNATSDFNVRIRKQGEKVLISVNLPNLVAERTVKPKGFQLVSTPQVVEARTTGVFENGLLNLLK